MLDLCPNYPSGHYCIHDVECDYIEVGSATHKTDNFKVVINSYMCPNKYLYVISVAYKGKNNKFKRIITKEKVYFNHDNIFRISKDISFDWDLQEIIIKYDLPTYC